MVKQRQRSNTLAYQRKVGRIEQAVNATTDTDNEDLETDNDEDSGLDDASNADVADTDVSDEIEEKEIDYNVNADDEEFEDELDERKPSEQPLLKSEFTRALYSYCSHFC